MFWTLRSIFAIESFYCSSYFLRWATWAEESLIWAFSVAESALASIDFKSRPIIYLNPFWRISFFPSSRFPLTTSFKTFFSGWESSADNPPLKYLLRAACRFPWFALTDFAWLIWIIISSLSFMTSLSFCLYFSNILSPRTFAKFCNLNQTNKYLKDV